MYAVIQTGGKQYRVAKGQKLRVEKLDRNLGDVVEFAEVLLIANDGKVTVGKPNVAGAKVMAKVIDHGRHKKIRIVKMRRRKHYEKQTGHRQYFTHIEIADIKA